MKDIKIPNNRGKLLAANLHEPTQPNGWLAVLCPGYLDSKDYAGLVALAQELCAHGYTVVRFDTTGMWASEGTIDEYLTSQYITDVGSVLDYMLARGEYKQVLLGGHSRGGQVSLLAAARDPRVSQVVAIFPSSRHSTARKKSQGWKEAGFRVSKRDVPNSTEVREFRVPWAHVVDRDQFDVINEVANVHVPIAMLAGGEDDTILPEEVKELYDNANEPKKYILVEGVDHDYRHDPEKIKKVNRAILKALMSSTKKGEHQALLDYTMHDWLGPKNDDLFSFT